MNLVSTQKHCKVHKRICVNNVHGYSYDRQIIFHRERFTLTMSILMPNLEFDTPQELLLAHACERTSDDQLKREKSTRVDSL